MTTQDKVLYMQSAEVHAAVHAVVDIAERYRTTSDLVAARDQLFEDLITFFGQFDNFRRDQIEFLRKNYIQLHMLYSKDPNLG